MKKEYEVPVDLANNMDEAAAYETLRDKYIKLPFGFKKAVKCAKLHHRIVREFWSAIQTLYPELANNNNLQYKRNENIVIILDANAQST